MEHQKIINLSLGNISNQLSKLRKNFWVEIITQVKHKHQ